MAKNIVYIIPINTNKSLVDSAWTFKSKNTIPTQALEKIVDILNLVFEEEYLGIKKYKNSFIDMNVVFTNNRINEICIRTTLQKDELIDELSKLLNSFELEIFDAN